MEGQQASNEDMKEGCDIHARMLEQYPEGMIGESILIS